MLSNKFGDDGLPNFLVNSLILVLFNLNYPISTRIAGSSFIHILVYVDDILIASSDEPAVTNLKLVFDQKFELKDLSNLKYFLDLKMHVAAKVWLFVKENMLQTLS